MTKKKLDLKRAYGLKTPEDSVDLYREWATTYDRDFAEAMDYNYPADIAALFADMAGASHTPVLDVGAGTGLVAENLIRLGNWQIDALDISPEMLEVAAAKECYTKSIQADLTQKIAINDGVYGGIISAGTFTHGHVGPGAVDQLLRIAKPGALFVLGVNKEVFVGAGFEAKFKALADQITDFQIIEKPVYGKKASPEHQNAVSNVAVFRRAG